MKAIYYILTRALSSNFSLSYYKSLANRINLYYGNRSSTKSKILTLIGLLTFPIYFFFRLKKHDFKVLVAGDASNSQELRNRRNLFIQSIRNDKETTHLLHLSESINFYHTGINVYKIRMIFKLWSIVLCSATLLPKHSKMNHSILFYAFINATNAILSENKKDVCEVFLFSLYRPSTYLSAVLIEAFTNCQLSVSTGNSLLYAYNRYIHLPQSRLLFCSVSQSEEINYFKALNWVQVKETVYAGSEDIDKNASIEDIHESYDIGIYSSGYWARIDGQWRSNDVEAIKEMKYANNDNEITFQKLLKETIRYATKHQLKVKIYTHPFERELYNKGITPPYHKLLIENNIYCDFTGTNSIIKVKEVRLGISLFSTICLDRWDLGLDALIIHTESSKHIMNPKALGKYNNYVCDGLSQLEEKLDVFFKTKQQHSTHRANPT